MSDPHSLPDNGALTMASGSFSDDWDLAEKSPTSDLPPFDGKIIARMPDLGSNGFVKNVVRPKNSLLGNVRDRLRRLVVSSSVRSVLGTRQQFFHRMTIAGSALLLCGMGLLFLDFDKEEFTEDFRLANVSDVLSEQRERPVEDAPFAQNESAFAPVLSAGGGGVPADSTVSIPPVADFAAIEHSVAGLSDQASPYSPWEVTPKQSEAEVAAVAPPSVSPTTTVVMTPMTPMSMPVSPYERQLAAQSVPPPVRPPVDPFVQVNHPHVAGMMPMHERLENRVQASPQHAPQSASAPPHSMPMVAVQGGTPVTMPPGQYVPYAAPPNSAPVSNMPIPSGVSTLSPQQGYYSSPYGNVPVQNSPHNFHPTVPPSYHRVY